tara:strand:- start:536 stop:1066 length:531 start_codon:yes stop_codon:yes gene_type:complete
VSNLEKYIEMIRAKLPQIGFSTREGEQIAGQDLILSAMSSKNMKGLIGLPTLMNVQIYIYSIFRPNLSIIDYTNFTEHCFQYFQDTVPKQGLLGRMFAPKPCAVIPLLFSENIAQEVLAAASSEPKTKWGQGIVLPYVIDVNTKNVYTLPNTPFFGKMLYEPAQKAMNWLLFPPPE